MLAGYALTTSIKREREKREREKEVKNQTRISAPIDCM